MMKSDTPLFILDGNGPVLNRGCEAILRSTLAILDRTFGECRYINSPGSGPTEFDSATVRRPDLVHLPLSSQKRGSRIQRLLNRISERREVLPFHSFLHDAAAVLALGGDNLSLDYGPPTRFFGAIESVIRAKSPMVVWGASIGPFTSAPDLERKYIGLLKRVSLICVRETATQAYLAQHSVSDNVRLVADPAFIMEPEPADLPQELREVLQVGAIGLNLSPLLGRYQERSRPWLESAARLIQSVDRVINRPIILIPHVIKPNNDDHAFLSEALALLTRTDNPIHLLGPAYNAPQTKWVISQLAAFVGARTHATIAALSTCVPTIAIGYSVKAQGITRDIFGDLRWLIPLDALTPDRLASAVTELLSDLPSVRSKLESVMPGYCQRSWDAGVLVRQMLEK